MVVVVVVVLLHAEARAGPAVSATSSTAMIDASLSFMFGLLLGLEPTIAGYSSEAQENIEIWGGNSEDVAFFISAGTDWVALSRVLPSRSCVIREWDELTKPFA